MRNHRRYNPYFLLSDVFKFVLTRFLHCTNFNVDKWPLSQTLECISCKNFLLFAYFSNLCFISSFSFFNRFCLFSKISFFFSIFFLFFYFIIISNHYIFFRKEPAFLVISNSFINSIYFLCILHMSKC